MLGLVSVGALSWGCAPPAQAPMASPARSAATPSPGPAAASDTNAAGRDQAVASLMQRLVGRENTPAESVFQSIRIFRGLPASRVLAIMNNGFGRRLGVGCMFCHVAGQWAAEGNPRKQVARDMWAMMGRINAELKTVPNLPDANAVVNCTTCHRGQTKPALNIPGG